MDTGAERGHQAEEGDLLKQQRGNQWPEGLLLEQLLRQKPRCERSPGRLWRLTFTWPQGSSGKLVDDSEGESRAWPRLCLAREEKF